MAYQGIYGERAQRAIMEFLEYQRSRND